VKRTGALTRKTPLRRSSSPLARSCPLPPISTRRRREEREFRPLSDAYLAGHKVCEFPDGCSAASVVVHHRRGRFGRRLVDVDWFAASCAFHNDFAETRTGEALRIGWLVRIEGAA
jgi:hypothetical protein